MESPLIVFVAMPGSDMGSHATWRNISEIKDHLYDPIVVQLNAVLGVEVSLRIEKDKFRGGDIYRSMFGEALQAPIYIADLTGANANVYLELGVRWALRDNVTVLVCQSIEHDVKFNVAANRVIPYGSGPAELEEARTRIVGAILDGLRDEHTDSPVRQGIGVVPISKVELDALRAENTRLHEERGDELVTAAETATHEERLSLLRRALQNNPANARAQSLLGVSLRKAGDYGTAVRHLSRAVQLVPNDGDAWRELGIAQSRDLQLENAIESLERAVALNPSDADAQSSLGGVFRRKARDFNDRTGEYDWSTLRQAKDAYKRAGRIDRRDTYPLLNVAKLDLLLSQGEATRQNEALEQFRTLENLARYTADTEGQADPWKWLDLADTLAVTGDSTGAVAAARKGIDMFEPQRRKSAIEAALSPLFDFIAADCLPADLLPSVQALVVEYENQLR